MAYAVPLDTRQARIARHLLVASSPATVQSIASALRLTPRMVHYNLKRIERYLGDRGLRVVRKPGVGVWLEGSEDQRRAVSATLDEATGPRVLDAAGRRVRALAALLDRAPDSLQMFELESELDASRQTVRRDVRDAESWLEEHRLHLQRLPGVGLAIRGDEIDVRKALLALILEAVPPDVLFAEDPGRHSRSADARGESDALLRFSATLEAPTYRAILTEQIHELDTASSMTTAGSVYLAIVAHRVRAGRRVRFRSGQLRSLIDHPVADAASAIAAAVERRVGLVLDEADVAAITEFLLGFAELVGTPSAPDDESERIERLVASAAKRIHPALAEDVELRRSLAEHVRRLRVRLRYGLPVSNPLDEEVRQRYPDVYKVASQIVTDLGDGDAVPSAEVGFLTMYLAGSLERNRLRPKVRVVVVCPAGMATAWILVSRLAAIFPQIEVSKVVSKEAFEGGTEDAGADIVISTVPVSPAGKRVRSVVVSPLLRDRDVRRLSQILGEPTH